MALKWTKSEMMEASVTVYGALLEGKSHAEIMTDMRWDSDTFEEVRRFMLNFHSDEVRNKPKEHSYVEYVIEQKRSIKDLDELIKNLNEKTQYNALVGAIRLRSDIVDKIVAKGQEFGFIKKTAERREIVGGLIIAELSNDDLKKAITDQNKLLSDAMEKYGEKEFTELAPVPLHYGAPIFKKSITTTGSASDEDDDEGDVKRLPSRSSGSARAKTSRRSAGRKRVRDE